MQDIRRRLAELFEILVLYVGLAIACSKSPTERVEQLFGQAQGVILDLGPGAGFTVKHFKRNQCTKIFGIEPNTNFHPTLRQKLVEAGLDDIYTIVPCGVEDTATMSNFGIEENSFDTIVACKVLCSVPDPDIMCKNLYRYLAPGGSLIALEHVRSSNGITWRIQSTLNHIWTFLFAGCNITRPTTKYLLEAGPWSEKRIGKPEDSEEHDVINWMTGTFTK